MGFTEVLCQGARFSDATLASARVMWPAHDELEAKIIRTDYLLLCV